MPFRHLKNDPNLLAREVLREVPRQLTNYFLKKGIKPNKREPKKNPNAWAQLKKDITGEENYYRTQKMNMLAGAIQVGYNSDQTLAFLDNIGIPENNFAWIQNCMVMQGYRNQMKLN